MNRSWSIGRHLSRLALALGLILGVVVTSATAASAHAVVVSSQPADGERLPTAPASVTLQFNEPVKADLGGLQVVDSQGKRVDTGTNRVTGDSLTTSLENDLPDGTYVASYRVTSADSHPVKGAIVFGIGDAPASGIDVGSITTGGADHTFDLLGWASRLLAYLGALTAAGLAFFLVFVHDGGPDARPLDGRLAGPRPGRRRRARRGRRGRARAGQVPPRRRGAARGNPPVRPRAARRRPAGVSRHD